MKPETDPIAQDEWLIRLVFRDRFTARVPIVAASTFEPRVKGRVPDTNGLSLFRKSCLSDPADALLAVPEDKRPLYGIVEVPISLLGELGLTATPDPIAEAPGHVVIPELNSNDCGAAPAKFTATKLRLAEVASEHILRRPLSDNSQREG
jgi:hypothetical protein